MDREELRRKVEKGELKRLHMLPIAAVFRPRGTMGKNSLSLELYQRLKGELAYWTNPKYADSVSEGEAREKLVAAMRQQVEAAITKFQEESGDD